MEHVKTLIVGGGMAGLGAARTLIAHGYDDFLLVTKNIGGRVLTSADGETNYGAFYVRKDYTHMREFVTREQRIRMRDMIFIEQGKKRRIISWRNLPHSLAAIRGVYLLYKFAHRYRALRERCEYMSLRDAFAHDAWSEKLYKQSAHDFIVEHGLQYWAKHFLNPIVRATAFLDIRQMRAFSMLVALLPTVIPSWEFTLHIEKMLRPIAEKVIDGVTIVSVVQDGEKWIVTDANNQIYRCRQLILALPITETKKLISLNEPTNSPTQAFLVHVRGKLNEKYADYPFIFFSTESPYVWITAEDGGTYLFYAQNRKYDLSKYFTDYEVITEHHWDPAFFLGPYITEISRGEGLYIIGGHNFATMEDAYISGVYAANQILKDR